MCYKIDNMMLVKSVHDKKAYTMKSVHDKKNAYTIKKHKAKR